MLKTLYFKDPDTGRTTNDAGLPITFSMIDIDARFALRNFPTQYSETPWPADVPAKKGNAAGASAAS